MKNSELEIQLCSSPLRNEPLFRLIRFTLAVKAYAQLFSTALSTAVELAH
jgi:hypothetical protein